jgi:hypothetical protein
MSLQVKDLISMAAKPGVGYGSENLLVDGKVTSTVCPVAQMDHSLPDA